MATGTSNAAFQVRADGHAGQVHVGGDDHAAVVGIDHAGDGHADGASGRSVLTPACVERVADGLFDGRDHLSGPPSRGVVQRRRPRMPPDSSTNEAWTFVPPTSTPR